MKISNEEFKKIIMKSELEYDMLKDKVHEQHYKIKQLQDDLDSEISSSTKAYARIIECIKILESIYMLDNVTITGNASEKIEEAIRLLKGEQNG